MQWLTIKWRILIPSLVVCLMLFNSHLLLNSTWHMTQAKGLIPSKVTTCVYSNNFYCRCLILSDTRVNQHWTQQVWIAPWWRAAVWPINPTPSMFTHTRGVTVIVWPGGTDEYIYILLVSDVSFQFRQRKLLPGQSTVRINRLPQNQVILFQVCLHCRQQFVCPLSVCVLSQRPAVSHLRPTVEQHVDCRWCSNISS